MRRCRGLWVVCSLLFSLSCQNYKFKNIGRKGRERGMEMQYIIIDLIRIVLSRHKISNMLNIPKLTVMYVARKFFDTGLVENKPSSGRPRDFHGLESLVKNASSGIAQ